MRQIVVDGVGTNYYITKDGRCYNKKTGKYINGRKKDDYTKYKIIMPDGTYHFMYAHRLVAKAYMDDFDDNWVVYHKDGNHANNYIDNLGVYFMPKLHEPIPNPHVFCFNRDKKLVAEYQNLIEACKAVRIPASMIQAELDKDVKSLTCGFYWSYENKLGKTISAKDRPHLKEVYQYTLEGKFINSYESAGAAARSLGLGSGTHIGECCRGKLDSYKGFIWRYADDIVSPSDENQRDSSSEES